VFGGRKTACEDHAEFPLKNKYIFRQLHSKI